MPSRQNGVVAKWLNHKGIGFITPDGETVGEKDVLVHFEQIKQTTADGFKSLNQGSKVEFELTSDPKNADKQVAINVTGPDGAECAPKEKKPKGAGKKGKGKKGKGKGKAKKGSASDETKEAADE